MKNGISQLALLATILVLVLLGQGGWAIFFAVIFVLTLA